jgi:hypothetical protein
MRCVAVCRGHTAAVGAVCFPNREVTSLRATGPAFLATASADMSVKLWDLRPVLQLLQRRRLAENKRRRRRRRRRQKRLGGSGGGGGEEDDQGDDDEEDETGGQEGEDGVDEHDEDEDEAEEEEDRGSEDDADAEPLALDVLCSVAAHKKDINAIAMSPNDQVRAGSVGLLSVLLCFLATAFRALWRLSPSLTTSSC